MRMEQPNIGDFNDFLFCGHMHSQLSQDWSAVSP